MSPVATCRRPAHLSAAACAILAIFANLACASAEQQQQTFPRLADIPPRPAAISADVNENERRYHQWVAELQAKRQQIINRLRQAETQRP